MACTSVEPLTNQTFFTKSVKGLLAQGHPSIVKGVDVVSITCAYRTPSGDGCAIGITFPAKGVYRKSMEGRPVEDIMNTSKGMRKYFAGVDPTLLATMQVAHDCGSYFSIEAWRSLWRESVMGIAECFNLKLPEEF